MQLYDCKYNAAIWLRKLLSAFLLKFYSNFLFYECV